jgi:hypothetical protein
MKNIVPTTASVCSCRDGENGLDDVTCLQGRECSVGFSVQWFRVALL